ncbi:MAG: cobalamin-binding protein [Chloroflexi bacterium]|nr:cobalamin-binding protein [Chloroflexota bacterium]MYC01579.1 cobalamin-binding protein [Chloroflexota bacterium]
MARIASLLPSATEIVCALGASDDLVGRSHECDFPAEVQHLPVLTSPRFLPAASSGEIDRQVRELALEARAEDALGVYAIEMDLLQQLGPTHIVTQTQCEVCAVSLRDVERAVEQLTGFDTKLIPLAPNSLDDIWDDIRRTAEALGLGDQGHSLIRELQDRIDSVPSTSNTPRVAVVEWAEPLMTAGHWTMELIERAGGVPVIGAPKGPSLHIQMSDLAEADPDFIIIAPCGFDLARTREDAKLLNAREDWRTLRAVREGRVSLIDGNQYVNRPGPRVVKTLEIIAEIINPDFREHQHEGLGWERVPS